MINKPSPLPSPLSKGEGVKLRRFRNMSWIIGRSAGSTQPSRGRVSLSLHSCQNPQFGMTINNIPLLEIKDFGPPARGGHFVRQSHKGRGNKAPSSKSQISVLPQGVDILCFFTPFYPISHSARSFTRLILWIASKKKIRSKPYLFYLRSKRFELPTFWFVAKRSIQLSYERIFFLHFLSYKKNRNISSIIFNFM